MIKLKSVEKYILLNVVINLPMLAAVILLGASPDSTGSVYAIFLSVLSVLYILYPFVLVAFIIVYLISMTVLTAFAQWGNLRRYPWYNNFCYWLRRDDR